MSILSLTRTNGAVQFGSFDTATSLGVSVTPGNAAWGSWTEVIASNQASTNRLLLSIKPNLVWNNDAEANYWYYLRVGVGTAGSEVQIGDVIPIWGSRGWMTLELDVTVNVGQRVAISMSGENTGAAIVVATTWYQAGAGCREVTDSTYTVTGGPTAPTTAISAPTADNTWSAWTQLVTTTQDADELMLFLQTEGRTGGEGHENKLFQIGKGAAGSETPVLTFGHYNSSYQGAFHIPYFVLPMGVVAGDRISIRWQSDTITTHTAYTTNAMFAFMRYL